MGQEAGSEMVVEGALSKEKLSPKLQQLWKAILDGEGSGKLLGTKVMGHLK